MASKNFNQNSNLYVNNGKLVAGYNNVATGGTKTSIIGGEGNNINELLQYYNTGSGATINSNHSLIGGGSGNTINAAPNSVIIGGDNSIIGRTGGNFHQGIYNKVVDISGLTSSSNHSIIGGGSGNVMGAATFYSYYVGQSALSPWNVGTTGTNSTDYSIIIGGVNNQVLGSTNAFIGAGENNRISSTVGVYGGLAYGYENRFSTIVNGKDNAIGGVLNNLYFSNYSNGEVFYASILGGSGNTINSKSHYSTIGGGIGNDIGNSKGGFIGGGKNNQSSGAYASVGGGEGNRTAGASSFVGAGASNLAGSTKAFIGAGMDNTTTGKYSGIMAGSGNTITTSFYTAIITGVGNQIGIGDNSPRRAAHYSLIGGGKNNEVRGRSLYSFIGNGENNVIGFSALYDPFNLHNSIVGGKDNSLISGNYNSIVGGKDNTTIGGFYSFIGGGSFNDIIGGAGGYGGTGSTIVGGGGLGETGGHLIKNASYASILGGQGNTITYNYIGALTSIYSDYSVIIGGRSNIITDSIASTILNSSVINGESGVHRIVQSDNSIIGGGSGNYISGGTNSQLGVTGPVLSGAGSNVVLAGYINEITDSEFTTIVNGLGNTMRDTYNSSILGGRENYLSGITNTHIIGSSISATTANTTYVNNLNINDTPLTSTTINDILVRDSDGTVKTRTVGSVTGGIQRYAADVAFTGGTAETITHNLDSTDVLIQIKDSSGVMLIPDVVDNYTSNTVDIELSITETYRIIIFG